MVLYMYFLDPNRGEVFPHRIRDGLDPPSVGTEPPGVLLEQARYFHRAETSVAVEKTTA